MVAPTIIASSGRARSMCYVPCHPIRSLPTRHKLHQDIHMIMENLVGERTTIKWVSVTSKKMSVSMMSANKDIVLLSTKRDLREVSESPSHVLHFVLLYKEEAILTNDSPPLPIFVSCFAWIWGCVPTETPSGLPPLCGIEHRVDLIPDAPLPNRPLTASAPRRQRNPTPSTRPPQQRACSWKS